MKTLEDVVAALDKHTEILDELLKATADISASQAGLASAVTLLISQMADQKAVQSG